MNVKYALIHLLQVYIYMNARVNSLVDTDKYILALWSKVKMTSLSNV